MIDDLLTDLQVRGSREPRGPRGPSGLRGSESQRVKGSEGRKGRKGQVGQVGQEGQVLDLDLICISTIFEDMSLDLRLGVALHYSDVSGLPPLFCNLQNSPSLSFLCQCTDDVTILVPFLFARAAVMNWMPQCSGAIYFQENSIIGIVKP